MTIGVPLLPDQLVLTTGRDFRWAFENLDDNNQPEAFPLGELYFELETDPVTQWDFTIDGTVAEIKIEHDEADAIPDRTKWQLVFLPDGEAAGGDPVALGVVRRQPR